jgi:L-alanine-DL-glutamate epimerase-like enolase superfamily enzyme
VENGYISLPERPGLGLDLDEEALLANPYVEQPPRDIRHYHEEGP